MKERFTVRRHYSEGGVKSCPSCTGASHFLLVLHIRLRRQENPKSVDAERGTEGNVEKQGREREYHRDRARPRFSLQQTPAGGKSREGFYDYDNSYKAQKRMQEDGSAWMCSLVENS